MKRINKIHARFARRLAKLFYVRGLARLVNLHVTVTCGSRKMRIPIINGLGLHNIFEMEEWMSVLIHRIFQIQQGAFFDIGANLGQSLLNLISVNAKTDYFGFEPNYTCCSYIDELIRINSLTNCHLIPAALSDKVEIGKIYLKTISGAEGSLVTNFRSKSFYSSTKYVCLINGDSYILSIDIPSIAIVKIDVEGGELEVVKGLRQTIARYRPFIICEILDNRGDLRRKRTQELTSILTEEDYAEYRLSPNGNATRLEGEIVTLDYSESNYLFVPKSKEASFRSIYSCIPQHM